MKIKYLGTGAYEGIPALFCTCPICLKAMEKGGKNIRTRSQALIDDKILIDFNADTYSHFITHKIDFTKVNGALSPILIMIILMLAIFKL